MTDEIMPSELGAFTNNLPNKEGIKKLCDKVNEGASGVEYTAGDNIQISADNVISATDTTYIGGDGISIVGNVINSGFKEHLYDEQNFAILDENTLFIKDTFFIIYSKYGTEDEKRRIQFISPVFPKGFNLGVDRVPFISCNTNTRLIQFIGRAYVIPSEATLSTGYFTFKYLEDATCTPSGSSGSGKYQLIMNELNQYEKKIYYHKETDFPSGTNNYGIGVFVND